MVAVPDPALPAPFRWEGEHIAADLPGGRVLFSTRRGGGLGGPVRVAQPRPPDRRRRRERRREPRARSPPPSGLPRERFIYGRQVHGATRPARDRAARAGAARGRGGRPGDRARRRGGARVRRRLPAGAAGRRRRGRGAARRLARAGGRDRRARASPRCASWAPTGALTAAIGPGARGCCYEVERGGPRRVRRRARAPGSASATSTCRRSRATGWREAGVEDDPRHRALHDLRRRRAVLLAPPGRRRHRAPGRGRVAGVSASTRPRARERRPHPRGDRRRRAPRRPRPRRRRAARRRQVRRRRGHRRAGRGRASRCSARTARSSSRPRPPRGRTPALRWHFIGQLQSRKVKQILPLVELIHSVASDSALAQLERHGTPETEILVEVNVAGEEGKAGIAPADLAAFLDRAPVRVAGLMGDAAVRGGSGGEPAALRGAARARRRARPAAPLDGHLAGLRGRRRGRGDDRAGSARYSSSEPSRGRESPAGNEVRTSNGLLRLLASRARLLRPRRGPRRVRGRGGAAGRDPPARGRAGGPLSRAAERPAAEHAAAPGRDRRHLRRRLAVRAAHHRAAPGRRPPGQRPQRQRGGPRAPGDPEVVQRRAGRRGQVQGRDPGDHQPPGIRDRPLQAPDRLRLGPDLRARRRDAADRRQGLPADSAQRGALSAKSARGSSRRAFSTRADRGSDDRSGARPRSPVASLVFCLRVSLVCAPRVT